MKNKILLTFLFLTTIVNSQVSDIANLTSGKLSLFSPIKELDGSIYGYLTIFKMDKISKTAEKYEYVLLDKNLNKVSNGEFTEIKYKGSYNTFLSPEKVGDKIVVTTKIYPIIQYAGAIKFVFTSHRTLDLKNNTISDPFYYKDNQVVEGNRDEAKIKSIVKKELMYDYPLAFSEGIFFFEKIKLKNKNLKDVKDIKAFGLDKKLLWSYEHNPDGEMLSYSFSVLDKKNVLLEIFNKEDKTITLHSIDPKTGALKFTYVVENKKSDYSHYYSIKALKDRFVLLGKFSSYKSTGYNYEKAKGYFRIEIDKEGKEISKKYLLWEDLASVIKVKGNGKLEDDNYRLSSKRFFVFEDGRTAIINEKRKESYNVLFGGTNVKTTDFIILNFDKDFNIASLDTIEKEKSKWSYSDYLFSQEIEDGRGGAFFYADYKKAEDGGKSKKNWVLGIVIMKDGKVSNEQIPMSSDEHFLYPYNAKEGFILLREFSKDEEHDQIRLERLNY